MKMLWCWRCKTEMPMLDEAEFERLHRHADGDGPPSMFRLFSTKPSPGSAEWRQRWLDEYERMTGYRETNPNAIWHHRIALHGEPCRHCGKPLRTPRAKLCAACGTAVAGLT